MESILNNLEQETPPRLSNVSNRQVSKTDDLRGEHDTSVPTETEHESGDDHWDPALYFEDELENIPVNDNLEVRPVTKLLMEVQKRMRNGSGQQNVRQVRHSLKQTGHNEAYRYARLRYCNHFWRIHSSNGEFTPSSRGHT